MLTTLGELPAGFLGATARDLHRLMPGPTLIHLPGRGLAPVFASILLHGNEDTGLRAVQRVLAEASSRGLPRALSVFVGNVQAAALGLRRLDGQPDYNRVWPGTDDAADLPEHAMMRWVVDDMRARGVFASVDIHNNTGLNPHYACVNRVEPPFLHLATLFSRTVVWFERPLGVQSQAFAALCPAVTVECGKPGNPEGEREAARLLEAVLHLDHLPLHPIPRQDIDLYHTVATVKIADGITCSFDGEPADLRFVPELERMNFSELAPGTEIAAVAAGRSEPLEVTDSSGAPATARFFSLVGGALRTRTAVMPAMLTRDERVIRQDCLCYLMERMSLRSSTRRG